jgi:signal transduction histidine kinase
LLRSYNLRLAAFFTLAFALSVIILGIVTLLNARAALTGQFDERILSDSNAMVQEYKAEGLAGVKVSIREHDLTPGALDFGLQSPAGVPIAGNFARARARLGWSTVGLSTNPLSEEGPSRIYVTQLPDGYRIIVGDSLARINVIDSVLVRSFGIAFIGVLLLGGLGGFSLSRTVGQRIASITHTAEAIIDGDMASRVPVRGTDDELDRLSSTLNRMLDRIAALMDSLRQVSTDVAHDLRTPLTRLRQRLETILGRTDGGESRDALESALSDLDDILATFAALLRISQIEGGARRAAFRRIDLTAIAATVVDAFRPSAEENGQTLGLEADTSIEIDGDKELLTQMLANLVENALRHAGQGADVHVRCHSLDDQNMLSVTDNGPGVPASERERLFDRFYRLEASRSTPGSGLGLALVAAVARLHGAEASLHDAYPGLTVRIVFPVGD